MTDMMPCAAPALALGAFHRSRPAPDRRGRPGAGSGSLPPRRSTSQADAWRAREAKSGRVYDCAKRSVAGFPFRLEVRCDGASVALVSQTAGKAPIVTAKLGQILVVAQIYDPKRVIAEFTAPATLSNARPQQSFAVNWSLGRSQRRSACRRCRSAPRSCSTIPRIDRVDGSVPVPLARAKHVELHGRLAEDRRPIIP